MARSMRENANRRCLTEREDRERSSEKSRANLLSMYDYDSDDCARRAGEIIARAATTVQRRGKRK